MSSRQSCIALLMCSFMVLAPQSNAANKACVWAGRVYLDTELKVNGQVCQICNDGKWIDHDVSCDKCKPQTKPDVTNPPPSDKDCSAQHQRDNPQKLTFSDGARVEQAGAKFQMCSSGVWLEKQAPQSNACK